MEQEKKYTKLGIFLFVFFIILSSVFAASIYKLIKNLFYGIEEKKNELKCSGLVYGINGISYKSNNLLFLLSSQDYDTNLTKITILSDTSESEYTKIIEPSLKAGESSFIQIKDIPLDKGFYIFLEDCKESKIFKEI